MAPSRKQFGKRIAPYNAMQSAGHHTKRSQKILSDYKYVPKENEDDFDFSTVFTVIVNALFGFQGRLGIIGYWMIGLFYWFSIAMTTQALDIDVTELLTFNLHAAFSHLTIFEYFIFLANTGILCLMRVSAEVRRFHDRDVSGYWYFGLFIPFVGLWLMLCNSLFPGTAGRNRFG